MASSIGSLRSARRASRYPARNARGRFAVIVDDEEVQNLTEAVRISCAPYSLADWMRRDASPLMGFAIAERFGDSGGGGVVGTWAPLAESTIRIKEALGVKDPEAINERSSSMVTAMVTDHRVSYDLVDRSATMAIPGDISDPVLVRKLRTANEGYVQGVNDMIPGAYTPPRPVNEIEPVDVVMLMVSMEVHIMNSIAALMNSSLTMSP